MVLFHFLAATRLALVVMCRFTARTSSVLVHFGFSSDPTNKRLPFNLPQGRNFCSCCALLYSNSAQLVVHDDAKHSYELKIGILRNDEEENDAGDACETDDDDDIHW